MPRTINFDSMMDKVMESLDLDRSEWKKTEPMELIRVGEYHGGWTTVKPFYLESLAKLFNEEQAANNADRPPLIIGHPNPWIDETEEPRVGEFIDIHTEGEGDDMSLVGTAEAIPIVGKMVKSGMWPGRSIGYYEDGEDTGRIMLDHVALLGKSRPGVPGLPGMQFSAKPGRKIFYLTSGESSARPKNHVPETPPRPTGTDQEPNGKAHEMKAKSLFGRLAAFWAGVWGTTPEEAAERLQTEDADAGQALRVLDASANEPEPEPNGEADDVDADADAGPEREETIDDQIAALREENEGLRERVDALEESAAGDLAARIADLLKFNAITKQQAAKLQALQPEAARVAIELAEQVGPRRTAQATPAAGVADPASPATPTGDAAIFEELTGRPPKDDEELAGLRELMPDKFTALAGKIGDVQGHA
jgi:hypothetical protein